MKFEVFSLLASFENENEQHFLYADGERVGFSDLQWNLYNKDTTGTTVNSRVQ